MLAFSVKNKKINHQRTDVGRRLNKTEFHETSIDASITTTATKIEINLVVTMIVQWLTDTIIKYCQN